MNTKQLFLNLLALMLMTMTYAQVGVGTTTPQGALDVSSTDKGLVLPRINLSTTTLVNPQGGTIPNGAMVYDTDPSFNCVRAYENGAWSTCLSSGGSSSGCTSLVGDPAISATANGTATTVAVCDGASLDLASTDNGNWSGASYSWTGPNGYTSTDQDPASFTFDAATQAGDYVVTITNATLAGCTATSTVTVTQAGVLTGNPASVTVDSGYDTIVKGSTGMTVTADLTGVSNASTLNWTVTETGGTGVTIQESGNTTHATAVGTTSITIDVAAAATTTSFTVSVQAQGACGDTSTTTTSSNITVQDALSVAQNTLTVAPHNTTGTLPTVSGSTSGSWTLATAPTITTSGVTPTYTAGTANNITSPSPATAQTISIATPTSATAATIAEDVTVSPAISPDRYDITASWVESYPATTYVSSTGLPQVAVTFIGCQNDISVGTGNIVQIMYDYDGNGSAEYSWCAREITLSNGQVWLDRNMGAYQRATSITDKASYGDLYQWGRPMDGHQKRYQRNNDAAEGSGASSQGFFANGTSPGPVNTDTPGVVTFITNTNDWRSDNNNNRWNTSPQGPCPAGYHVPTQTEFNTLTTSVTSTDQAFSDLALPQSRRRLRTNGSLDNSSTGNHWSSTKSGSPIRLENIGSSPGSVNVGFSNAGNGFTVRCVKD